MARYWISILLIMVTFLYLYVLLEFGKEYSLIIALLGGIFFMLDGIHDRLIEIRNSKK